MAGRATTEHNSTTSTLIAHGLDCRRGERLVFARLGFTLQPGEALVVRGANGSGKSSLLRILAGLLRADAGTVKFGEHDIEEDLPQWRRRIAWLGHQDGMKPGETPEEFLSYAWALRGRPLGGGHPALALLGMESHARTPAYRLSAGQKRRVALAAAVASDAMVWLIDEPTTALDAQATALFHDCLARHLTAGGMAVITTHDAIPKLPRLKTLSLVGEGK